MGIYIKTCGALSVEQAIKDENIEVFFEKDNDTKVHYIQLKGDEDAFGIWFGDDECDLFKVKTEGCLRLFKYLFKTYDMFFCEEDYIEYAWYEKGYGVPAVYWEGMTRYMLDVYNGSDDKEAIDKIQKQRDIWLPIYEFNELSRVIYCVKEVDSIFADVLFSKKITNKQIYTIESFKENTLMLLDSVYGKDIPNMIKESLKDACAEYDRLRDENALEIIKEFTPKPKDNTEEKQEKEDDGLPF
jgi:hypothetical protein